MSTRWSRWLAVALLLSGLSGRGAAGKMTNAPGSQAMSVDIVRRVQFAGYEWEVKNSAAGRKRGPGPNYWGSSNENVWVDPAGRLHLKITRKDGADGRPRWYCAEVICQKSFGYGTYRWDLDTPIGSDPNVVLGLFTWDDDPEAVRVHHREIDIELFCTWGEPDSLLNAQYCVQPWTRARNRLRFTVSPDVGSATTHAFVWRTNVVEFRSQRGHGPAASGPDGLLRDWRFSGSGVPPAGGENVRMNLWLLGGAEGPTNEVEVIVSQFEFEPLAK